MIISENNQPTFENFAALMASADQLLNAEAAGRELYYRGRNGIDLEEDVCDALCRVAKGTPFEGTIQRISGSSFPDIVANRFYGVEVKSTNKNHWRSIGSSILESTRISDVQRIFLTFGKLGSPVMFKSRPYEDCLCGISVTHYPRYQIDMELAEGETIFDKMGIPYDELRQMENPVVPVSRYYRSQLQPGESLWWAADDTPDETAVPPTIRLWSNLSRAQKDECRAMGYALFPEVLASNYQRYAVWLVSRCSIVDPHIRDQFSAGGVKTVVTVNGVFERMPAVFGRLQTNRDGILQAILSTEQSVLCEYWNASELGRDRIEQWCRLAAHAVRMKLDERDAYRMLAGIFGIEVF
ncbi:MAG: hypothetical protein IJY42_03445 [Clostridia bacterium]|nr:hypothetical protein [Clostridia bacterium]